MFAVFATQKCVDGRASNIQIIIRFWETAHLTKYSLLTLCLLLTSRFTTRELRYAIGVIEYNSFLVVNLRCRPLYSKTGTTTIENNTKL